MANTTELDRLIVLSIADLDATATRLDGLGDRLWKEIYELAERWAAEHGWFGEFSESGIWLAPAEWRQEEVDDALGWFYLDVGPDDTQAHLPGEPYFWVSRLLGEAGGEFCLWFGQNAAKQRVWKPFAREAATALAEQGFHMSDACNFFFRCSLDKSRVAQALADGDLDEAFEPIRLALERAKDALPLFQTLLDKAQKS